MRRLARIVAGPHFLVMLCQGDRFLAEENLLPEDAALVFADVDGQGRIVLTLESASFAEVAPGQPVPELPAPLFRRCR